MREFSNGRSAIGRLKIETKLIYTAFLVFSLVSYLVMAIIASQRAGWSLEVLSDYYQGNESKNLFAKSPAELLEVSHFHLFTIPLMLLIQGHIFVMSTCPKRLAALIVGCSFLSAAAYIAAPWLVLYLGSGVSMLGVLGRGILMLSLVVMSIYPLRDMWK